MAYITPTQRLTSLHATRTQDPLAKLEHVTEDKRRAKSTLSRINELVMDADIKFGDDYAINRLLRAKNRCLRAFPAVVHFLGCL